MRVRTIALLLPLLVPLLVARVAHAKDARAVSRLTEELDHLERKIAQGDLDRLGFDAWGLYEKFTDVDRELKSDPAFPALVKRWQDLGAKAAAAAGGHSQEILGDGRVPPGDDKERAELFDEVESACRIAANTSHSMSSTDMKNLKDNYGKYEKALARAIKADPTSVRYKNGHFKLFECEWKVAQLRMDFEDNANTEDSSTEHYKTCGYDEYVFRRLKMGSRWGAWEVDGVPGSNGYPLDCKKHPRVNKLSGNMAALIKQEYKYPSGAVWTIFGQPTTNEVELRIYQYQTVRVYSKDITVATNACGEKDKKIVCEASGAKLVQAYNAVAHRIARAELHRGAGRTERCKHLYQEARKDAKQVMESYESESKSSGWDKTFKYKTRSDGILTEDKLIARLTEMAAQADARSIGKYCQK